MKVANSLLKLTKGTLIFRQQCFRGGLDGFDLRLSGRTTLAVNTLQ